MILIGRIIKGISVALSVCISRSRIDIMINGVVSKQNGLHYGNDKKHVCKSQSVHSPELAELLGASKKCVNL